MAEHSEVVIVGGGIIGTSAAFHLAEAGVQVTLVERGELASGTSGSAAGIARAYFPGEPHKTALAIRSVQAYRGFAERTGGDAEVSEAGFLFPLTEKHQVADFHAEADSHRMLGVDLRLLTPEQAVERNPLLDGERILAAAWSPDAVTCNASDAVHGYALAAQKMGADIRTRTPVIRIDPETGRVDTDSGPITADAIVLAAGYWSRELAAGAGLGLPITPQPEELLFTDPLPEPPSVAMTLDATGGLRMRGIGNRLMVGMHIPQGGESRDAWMQRLATALATICPPLSGVGLNSAWFGVEELAPDMAPFLGVHPGPTRLIYATGFSGHGLSQAPCAGEIVRDLYLESESSVDLRRFSATRFTQVA
ncbi:NAD(P)/FAD-dependent oxidoreductase [Nocardia brevicatena]|uniref:NAD(P)/FAD-dependent oxidoreductase n=1 Tax=Nocardia brevicatena TaxID=37327 RepID=UPI0003066F1D|nr:FAD-binding oxidoreductase [Nocardia brevicatena]